MTRSLVVIVGFVLVVACPSIAMAEVRDPAGTSIQAIAGQQFDGVVAEFSSSASDPARFSATVDWGDSTAQSTATSIAPQPGQPSRYSVDASHTYGQAGTYRITVVILDAGDMSSGTASGTATVVVAPPVPPDAPAVMPVARSVSIAYSDRRYDQGRERAVPRDCPGCFQGRIASPNPVCLSGKVIVFRRRSGDDRRVGSAQSALSGRWKLKAPRMHGEFYAVTLATNGDAPLCMSARSKTIVLAPCPRSTECPGQPVLRVPSARFQRIQPAVDAAPDGATIRVSPGVYAETLDVRHKTLEIVASGHGRTEIRGPRADRTTPAGKARGVVNYVSGGGGALSNLVLTGGDAGIVARGRGSGSRLEVSGSTITESGRGVLWDSAGELRLQDSTVKNVLGNGVVAIDLDLLTLDAVTLAALGGAGVYVTGVPPNGCHSLSEVTVKSAKISGIFAYDTCVDVTESQLTFNTRAGIWLREALGFVTDSVMAHTKKQSDGRWGDGIQAELSTVGVSDLTISHNGRAGISNAGGLAVVTDTMLADNVFSFVGVDVEPDYYGPGVPAQGAEFEFGDGGGIQCFKQLAPIACLVESPELQAPEIPDP